MVRYVILMSFGFELREQFREDNMVHPVHKSASKFNFYMNLSLNGPQAIFLFFKEQQILQRECPLCLLLPSKSRHRQRNCPCNFTWLNAIAKVRRRRLEHPAHIYWFSSTTHSWLTCLWILETRGLEQEICSPIYSPVHLHSNVRQDFLNMQAKYIERERVKEE